MSDETKPIEQTIENKLQTSWRPILMLSITAILVNNYILVPYLSAVGVPVAMIEIPEKMWNLLTICLGTLIAGRSAEKGISKWKGAQK